MIKVPAHPTIERFRSDFARRYPTYPDKRRSRAGGQDGGGEPTPPLEPRLQKLPPEIGVLLMVIGIAGVLLPGPVGSPFLVAGGLALWPAGFRRVELWFMRAAPQLYDTGIRQIEHYLADLERRYPGSVRMTVPSGRTIGRQ